MRKDVDLSRTHEVIEMLDLIYDSVEEGCKDRCYIKGSGAESVKFVLEEAMEYLRIYALTNTTQLHTLEKEYLRVDVSEVIDMMKAKLSGMYGKCCNIDTDSAKEGTDEANKP